MKQLKAKRKSDFTSKAIYDYYKETHTSPLSKKDFMNVCKMFNKRLVSKIYDGVIAQLPGNLGFLGIQSKNHTVEFTDEGDIDLKKSTISTDWGATNKLWREKPELKHVKYIFHENLHTNGKRFRICWSRLYTTIPALYYYRFLPTRAFKRNLAKYIKNNPNKEYYEF